MAAGKNVQGCHKRTTQGLKSLHVCIAPAGGSHALQVKVEAISWHQL